jgi:hypothetical protein
MREGEGLRPSTPSIALARIDPMILDLLPLIAVAIVLVLLLLEVLRVRRRHDPDD